MRSFLSLPHRTPNQCSVLRTSLRAILDPKQPFNFSLKDPNLKVFAEMLLTSPLAPNGIIQPHTRLSTTTLDSGESHRLPHRFIDSCTKHIHLSTPSKNRLKELNSWLEHHPHTLMVLYQQPVNWMLPLLLGDIAKNLKPYTPNQLEAAAPTLNRKNESLLASFYTGAQVTTTSSVDQRFSLMIGEFAFPVHKVLECSIERNQPPPSICL